MLANMLPLVLLAAGAAAQTTTTTAPSSDGTSLPGLVGEIDSCVLGCIATVAPDVGCASTDFECLCALNPADFRSQVQNCVLGGGCNLQDALGSAQLIDPICDAVRANPDPSAIASASRIVEQATETSSGPDSTGSPDDEGAAASVVASGLFAAIVAVMAI